MKEKPLNLEQYFSERNLGSVSKGALQIQNVGLLNSSIPNTWSYILDNKYLPDLCSNSNITGVFTYPELVHEIPEKYIALECLDPTLEFSLLFNQFHRSRHAKVENVISPGAKISDSAYVAPNNVEIGHNVIIRPGAVILEDVVIGDGVEVREGSVIGATDIEMRRTSEGIIDIYHNKKVIIGENAVIGSNCTIDKGIYERNSVIGKGTRLGNNTLIGHGAQIGEDSAILCCTICGSSTIGDRVRINPGAVVSNGLTIGNEAVVTVGSIVVTDVGDGKTVSGNFAINHGRFLRNYMRTMGNIESDK